VRLLPATAAAAPSQTTPLSAVDARPIERKAMVQQIRISVYLLTKNTTLSKQNSSLQEVTYYTICAQSAAASVI